MRVINNTTRQGSISIAVTVQWFYCRHLISSIKLTSKELLSECSDKNTLDCQRNSIARPKYLVMPVCTPLVTRSRLTFSIDRLASPRSSSRRRCQSLKIIIVPPRKGQSDQLNNSLLKCKHMIHNFIVLPLRIDLPVRGLIRYQRDARKDVLIHSLLRPILLLQTVIIYLFLSADNRHPPQHAVLKGMGLYP